MSKYDIGCTETLELSPTLTARVTLERDDDAGEPWNECDCYGVVSEWTRRDKAPGEMVLCSDRQSKRYYDFAASVAIAKRDGWGGHSGATPGERAHNAVMADYKRLRAWCADDWCYAVAHVELLRDGIVVSEDYLGGIESDYADDPVQEMIDGLRRGYEREQTERAHWEARDVVTA